MFLVWLNTQKSLKLIAPVKKRNSLKSKIVILTFLSRTNAVSKGVRLYALQRRKLHTKADCGRFPVNPDDYRDRAERYPPKTTTAELTG